MLIRSEDSASSPQERDMPPIPANPHVTVAPSRPEVRYRSPFHAFQSTYSTRFAAKTAPAPTALAAGIQPANRVLRQKRQPSFQSSRRREAKVRIRQNRQPPYRLLCRRGNRNEIPAESATAVLSPCSFVFLRFLRVESAHPGTIGNRFVFCGKNGNHLDRLLSVPRSWLVTPVRSFRKEDHQMTYNEGKFPPRTRLEQAARK